MSEWIRLVITVEALGAACLPLAVWFFRALPDRGYILARTLGLLLVTLIVWLLGNAVPWAAPPWMAIAVTAVVAGLCWSRGHRATIRALSGIKTIVLVEEVIFIGALIVWSLLRAYVMHPDIAHTEQYMDMAFFNSSARSVSYPPQDPWMSGLGINYYYFGYLAFATVSKVAGVAPAVGYNLALSLIAALTLAGTFSVGYAFTRRIGWALLAPVFVELLGNWHAASMLLTHGHLSAAPGGNWIWESTRVVGSLSDYTINEFPLFSLVLGDLHPHLMSLPFTLLAVATSIAVLHETSPLQLSWDSSGLGRIALCAVILGSLFAINSWDFPTYGLLLFMAMFGQAYLLDASVMWWRRPLQVVVATAFLSVVAYAPFYAHFKSLAHGIGVVYTRSDIFQFLQVFGYPFLLCAVLVLSLGLLLRPVDEGKGDVVEGSGASAFSLAERGAVQALTIAGVGIAAACCLIAVVFRLEVLLLCLVVGLGALGMLQRVLNTDEPNTADACALGLVAVACLVLALTEVIYLKDAFDGSTMYRMNTVFKFYYQAWLLLMLAASYGAYRVFRITWRHLSLSWSAVTAATFVAGLCGGLVATVNGPSASFAAGSAIQSLDGMAWMQAAHPDDFRAIGWLRTHAPDGSVVLEAESEKSGYNPDYGRVSVFTGLPTVMGWPDHERQWRPDNADIGRRSVDVNSIYTSPDARTAERLMRLYRVRYVFVGTTEQRDYGANPSGLNKFGTFMRPVFTAGSTRIYAW
ncbi:MAG: DUF2298 domain-containing protein [Chloroflexota bacterium]